MRSHYKRIGDYVTQIKLKNTNDSISSLKGININKHFMPSVANINGTDLSKYRVVKKNQFAFNPMHVGRDEVLPISMLEDDEPIIVSPAYVVFEVKDEEELLPAYLMMWCRRSEFDRNAWFMTDNSVRGGFSWADFCDMELPVPSIEKQREIVREYNVIDDRIALNEQLTQKLEDTAQAIYKQWFVDFEFPISKEYAESIGKPELEGKPYKSSGGEMVFCEECDQELPVGWEFDYFGRIIKVQSGFAFKSFEFEPEGGQKIIKIKNITPPTINLDQAMCFSGELNEKLEKYQAKFGDILISMTGSTANQMNSAVGQVGRYLLDYMSLLNQRVGLLNILDSAISREFCYQFISAQDTHLELLSGSTGSANQANISPSQIEGLRLPIPTGEVMVAYDRAAESIVDCIALHHQETSKLEELKTIINIKMSKA
ncbi:restriction endonuclease subunit S [Vibrio alginolyticus]|uniref:restriction endonuclease subunit S n=1 Tax=Vibrio alginolyticus TaxID=663 RepID=UPI001EE9FBFB|nr:restriction endonuclease subunit S [Vibrio alginolyticus]MCG6326979.1 restriction endonuclease subunit S [Vibrio alginolyticus]